MATHYLGNDGRVHTASEREELARKKLHDQVVELRASLLDVLTLVRASTDPVAAVSDVAWSRTDELRNEIRRIEHRDHIIRRARSVIDGTKDAEKYTGPQNG